MDDSTRQPFTVDGPIPPERPVIVAIPHAGRHYPPELLAMARVHPSVLQRLEDRHVDALAADAIAQGTTVVTATIARAFIDLNRAEDEWDGALVADAIPPSLVPARVRSGLGIVPRRLHPIGDLWRRRLTHAELLARIEAVHRPYHALIATSLSAAHTRFGHAVLIDLHSMPQQPGGTPQFVVGDRHGSSAGNELVDRLLAAAEGHGLTVARNTPYAGAYGIARHGHPGNGREAVQIEFDRSLYCDAQGRPDHSRIAPLSALVAALVTVAEDHVFSRSSDRLAAE
jgi:N-formylglutamate amidohydrolase